MGDVIPINYPATRKFLALERRARGIPFDQPDSDLDSALKDLREDNFSTILEKDEEMFAEDMRNKTKILNGGLVLLFRYHGIMSFVRWFKTQQVIQGKSFAVRLTDEIEPWILLEAHNVEKILRDIRNNTNHQYLDRLEIRIRDFLVVETKKNMRFLEPFVE